MKKVIFLFILFLTYSGYSQVTTSAISGTVKTSAGKALVGAAVEIKHVPSGTKYLSTTNDAGNYGAPSVRPGGPYTVKVSYVGFKTSETIEVMAPLGNNINVKVVMEPEINALQEVVVKTASTKNAFAKNRTGAAQQFSTREINAIPVTGARSITAITKYNANAGANGTFGGQDSRMNNFTIDGSVFNNGFGLGGESQAGGRTGASAISLDAIEQLQVNIAPFDVRQTGFTGSGINAVTRSGTNEVEASAYSSMRSSEPNFIGTTPGEVRIIPGTFEERIYGGRFGAPIIKDKLFIFGSYEMIDNTSPATTWTSTGSPLGGGQVSAPTFTQMQDLSNFMRDKFGYVTGPWENFDAKRESRKFLIKLDWNINNNNKFSIRYIQHDSFSDEMISNSNSLGIGSRRTNPFAMSFQNSGYVQRDDTKSIVAQLDTKFSNKLFNNFIAGYTYQNEDRALFPGSTMFPTIDIRDGAPLPAPAVGFSGGTRNFISLGLDPFTPGNKLDYSSFHITNNLTKYAGNHTLLFGFNYENRVSNNSFFPGSNGVYVFNSLDQFYLAANESLAANGAPTVNNRPDLFQYRFSALPGGAEPLQVVKSHKFDVYFQDDYKVSDNLKMSFGIRATRMSFENTGLENPAVTALSFRNGEKFNTADMPKAQFLFEPRVGFNLDVTGNGNTQVRGGTGVFTGTPPYVFISNGIGNNGALTGFIESTTAGFTANPTPPANPTAPSSFDLAFTDRNFKFPQVWKSTIALDQKLPFGLIGTIEGVYNRNINEVYYYNTNFADAVGTLNGTVSGDNRDLFGSTSVGTSTSVNLNGVRNNNNVSNAIVLSNSSKGEFYSTTVKLELPYRKGLWGSVAYTRSETFDLMSTGSIASGSWNGARSVNGNNNLDLASGNNNTPHRIVGVIGYKIEYGKKAGAATSINFGYIGEESGTMSYTYGGDLNRDGISNNDLLFVPLKASDLRFAPITQNLGGSSQVLFTEAQQQEAFDKYIDQDPYLSTRRGQYAERNSNILPMLHRVDMSITQDFFLRISGKKHSFQFRADILNFGNLLNRTWGVTQRFTNPNILTVSVPNAPSAANNFTPTYQMGFQTDNQGKRFLARDTTVKNGSTFDVWQAQFTLRYTFGK